MDKKLLAIFVLALITLATVGCGEKTSSSLRPQSQLDFEKELKSMQARVNNSGPHGSRAYEEAKAALDNFWKNKRANMTRVDGWVCMHTDSFKWQPRINNPYGESGPAEKNEYSLPGDFCSDADIPYERFMGFRQGHTYVKIPVSKAQNIEPLYPGDVIAITGKIRSIGPDIDILRNYYIRIDADSIKVVKKGN